VIELAKREGQIAIDLAAACNVGDKGIYEPQAVRNEMGGAFAHDVHHPPDTHRRKSDMQYVEL